MRIAESLGETLPPPCITEYNSLLGKSLAFVGRFDYET